VTNNAPQGPPPDIAGSGLAALAAWLDANGWGVIGLGIFAMVITWLATELVKAMIDWACSPNRARPVAMKDDTHKLAIRAASVGCGMAAASMLGFADHVGPAMGVRFDLFSELVVGGLMNSGAAAGAFHAYKWLRDSDADAAKRVRRTARVWWGRVFRVTEDELDTAATSIRNPAITDAMIEADRKAKGLDDGQ
jgi:hypothetical protein